MRIVMIVLALLQLVVVVFVAAVGGFADGGTWWERATLMAVQPLAAIGLLVLVFTSRPAAFFTRLIVGLLAINIAADIIVAAAIVLDISQGDWWLSLVFSVIPVIGLLYASSLSSRRR